jgi:hypothetical protein
VWGLAAPPLLIAPQFPECCWSEARSLRNSASDFGTTSVLPSFDSCQPHDSPLSYAIPCRSTHFPRVHRGTVLCLARIGASWPPFGWDLAAVLPRSGSGRTSSSSLPAPLVVVDLSSSRKPLPTPQNALREQTGYSAACGALPLLGVQLQQRRSGVGSTSTFLHAVLRLHVLMLRKFSARRLPANC